MGPTQINGLPAHPLLVHVVVILVPLAALMVAASALLPAVRRRLGILTPLVAFVALVSVPLTTHAGEWLEARLPSSPLVRRHAELGDQLLPWAAGLFVLAAAGWLWARRAASGGATPTPATTPATATTAPATDRAGAGHPAGGVGTRDRVVMIVLAVLSVVVAVGSVVQVYRIGDSGAKAVWQGSYSAAPGPGDHG
jgi:3D (Asp-Asp-Asp) domain-containing protein